MVAVVVVVAVAVGVAMSHFDSTACQYCLRADGTTRMYDAAACDACMLEEERALEADALATADTEPPPDERRCDYRKPGGPCGEWAVAQVPGLSLFACAEHLAYEAARPDGDDADLALRMGRLEASLDMIQAVKDAGGTTRMALAAMRAARRA